jgi:hypothetical protein
MSRDGRPRHALHKGTENPEPREVAAADEARYCIRHRPCCMPVHHRRKIVDDCPCTGRAIAPPQHDCTPTIAHPSPPGSQNKDRQKEGKEPPLDAT